MSSTIQRLNAIEGRLDKQRHGPRYENPDAFTGETLEERLGRIEFLVSRLGNELTQVESDVSSLFYAHPKIGRLVL